MLPERLYFQLFVEGLVSFFTLFVLVCVYWCPTHIGLCFCFVCLRLVYIFILIIQNTMPYVASFSGLSICYNTFSEIRLFLFFVCSHFVLGAINTLVGYSLFIDVICYIVILGYYAV
jgi:hypothetical protein